MLSSVVRFFWPSIDKTDVRKFSLLSLTFFLIIGSYWLLRLLKDTVFMKIAFPESLGWAAQQGGLYQPYAKTASVFVVIACIFIYSKLVDTFKKHQLFYVIATFYAAVFGSITTALFLRSMYGDAFLGKTLLASVGWITYWSIESYGSLMVPLFWSFVISVTDSNKAKTGFPLIIAGAQIGSIGFSGLTIFASELGGIRRLFAIATLLVLAIVAVVYYFMKVIPADHLVGDKKVAEAEKQGQKKKEKENFFAGFYNGLRLLLTTPYLLGVLVVSTVYEIVGTIVDYQMKRYAAISPQFAGEAGFAKFMGIFGVCVNSLAFIIALLGTSYLLKKYGIRICLLIYPIIFGIALIGFYGAYSAGWLVDGRMLWALFAVMVLARGLTYAVNNPSKDMMYIPTSKDVRYKAKGWTDMFGGRTAKATGSQVTSALRHDLALLVTVGTVIGLGVIAFWILAALFVGKKNEQLIRDGEIIS